jgi:TatD DNase family protein
VVALGETGLDYHRLPGVTDGSVPDAQGLKDKQRRLFEQHLETAAAHGLNCIIHQRDALADTLAVMERFRGRVRGQFHCFVDDVLALRRVLALGSIVSFTGILTFKNAEGVRRTLVSATLEDFLLETDCPFLAPVPHRGRRAEPAHLALIAAAAGQVKGVPLATLAEATCATAHRFFPKLGH